MANHPYRPRCYLDVSIGTQPAGRLTVELFEDHTPRTAENFRQLCTGECNGLSYAQSPFHRVIDEFIIQGGDIANHDGTGTTSIYGGEFPDENLNWREMDSAGLLCSANRGKDTNGSQFFITLEPTPHLNGKHTIFGRLVSGEDVLEAIAKLDVDQNDRPIEPVLISRCGELEKRQKYTGPTSRSERNGTRSERAQLRAESNERGRRRESNPSEDDMGRPPTPERPRRTRRQSDNVVDEGLRGRPRQRSRSRSCSQPLSTPSEEISDYSDQYSPVKKHKRKRSASPSRHKDLLRPDLSTDSFSHDRRRRRSLPNQYPQEEQERYRPSPRRATDDRYAGNRRREDGYRSDRSDRYRPARDRYGDDGRLEVGAYDDYDYEPPVKFKGRGVMKFREPGRL